MSDRGDEGTSFKSPEDILGSHRHTKRLHIVYLALDVPVEHLTQVTGTQASPN